MSIPFDPLAILETLNRHRAEFVVIGGFAGNVWGSPTITNDLDICYSRESRAELVSALQELAARPREFPADLPFILDERTIQLGDTFTFETTRGNLDCLATPSGTRGFGDLASNSRALDLGEGLVVCFASVPDLIRMKRAAARPKDLIEVEILTALLEEIERSSSASKPDRRRE